MNKFIWFFQNSIKNLLLAAIKCKKFGAIGPIYENEKKNYKNKFNEVEYDKYNTPDKKITDFKTEGHE